MDVDHNFIDKQIFAFFAPGILVSFIAEEK